MFVCFQRIDSETTETISKNFALLESYIHYPQVFILTKTPIMYWSDFENSVTYIRNKKEEIIIRLTQDAQTTITINFKHMHIKEKKQHLHFFLLHFMPMYLL